MELPELKDILDDTPGDTRVSPSAVVGRVDRRRARVQRSVAAVAAVALVGTAGVALALRQGPDAVPASPDTSAPTPAPTATRTVQVDPAAVAPLETYSECTIEAPESWLALISAAPANPPDGSPWVEQSGTTITWHGETSRAIAQDAAPDSPEFTDGRFVVYVDDVGRVMVWDSTHPDAPPEAVTGPEYSPTESLGFFQLDDGLLWLSTTVAHSEDYKSSGDYTGRVEVVRIDGDREPSLVVEEKGLNMVEVWDGAIQTMLHDDPAITLYEPDGAVREHPLPEELRSHRVLSASEQALMLFDKDGVSSLYLPESDEQFTINSVEGPGGTVDGGWALLGGDGMEARQVLLDLRAKVRVNLPDVDPAGNAYSLRDGYLWVTNPGNPMASDPIDVADLPEVDCP